MLSNLFRICFNNFQNIYLHCLLISNSKMTDALIQDSFRRKQAIKSRFSGHIPFGYTHGQGEKIPKTNVITNEFLSTYRQRRATEWQPVCFSEYPLPFEITCYPIYHTHVGHIPNYCGHIPGAKFRCGITFGKDTIDAKKWLRCELKN